MIVLNKNILDIVVFSLAVCSIGVYLFTGNMLSFGFMLLFSTMFITDSFIYFFKKKFNSSSPIGGDYAGKNNSYNK